MIKQAAIIFSLICILGFTVFSQEAIQKGYIEPLFDYTSISGQPVLSVGGKAMWVVGRHFGLGGSVLISTNSIPSPYYSPGGDRYGMTMTRTGFEFEYLFKAANTILVTAGILVGGGSIEFSPSDTSRLPRGFYLLEPKLHLGVSLSDYSMVTLGAGYRLLFKYEDDAILTKKNIQGLSIDLGISTHPKQVEYHGGYIAPVMKSASLNGHSALLLGAKAMWVMDGQFGVGGGIYVSANSIDSPESNAFGNPYTLTLSYGGVHLEYIQTLGRDCKLMVDMLCAGADVKYSPPNDGNKNPTFYPGQFLVWEPQVNLSISLSNYVAVGIGAGYRLLSQYQTYHNLQKNDLQGLSSNLTFTFGRFCK